MQPYVSGLKVFFGIFVSEVCLQFAQFIHSFFCSHFINSLSFPLLMVRKFKDCVDTINGNISITGSAQWKYLVSVPLLEY